MNMNSEKFQLLDLFCGRWGWSRAFASRGWNCVGVDLVAPPEVPENCEFRHLDVLTLTPAFVRQFDFVCASSPCEEFSIHGMKHFHPNPKHPEMGIKLFEHTRSICEASGVPYVLENVRPAQNFVGRAVHHCGPFYLWGNAVPPLMPQGINKGMQLGSTKILKSMTIEERRAERKKYPMLMSSSGGPERARQTAEAATIPPELAKAVVDYAEYLLRESVLQSLPHEQEIR